MGDRMRGSHASDRPSTKQCQHYRSKCDNQHFRFNLLNSHHWRAQQLVQHQNSCTSTRDNTHRNRKTTHTKDQETWRNKQMHAIADTGQWKISTLMKKICSPSTEFQKSKLRAEQKNHMKQVVIPRVKTRTKGHQIFLFREESRDPKIFRAFNSIKNIICPPYNSN